MKTFVYLPFFESFMWNDVIASSGCSLRALIRSMTSTLTSSRSLRTCAGSSIGNFSGPNESIRMSGRSFVLEGLEGREPRAVGEDGGVLEVVVVVVVVVGAVGSSCASELSFLSTLSIFFCGK